MRIVRLLRLLSVFVVIGGVGLVGLPYVHGLSFVVRAADTRGTARRLADLDTIAEHERDISIPTLRGPLRARAYEPAGRFHRTALLVSGLHPSGIDEPRLVRFARQLSASGVAVVTPDIPELSRFEVTPVITDTIERAAVWLATESGLSAGAPIGLFGISFSGGLSIVAAGRPSLAGHVAYVFSLGGPDDLPRVLRYLCTGSEPYPPGRIRLTGEHSGQPFVSPPHDYGVAAVLLGVADHLVPRAQVEPLRAAVRRYLWASALDGGVDRSRAPAEFAAVRALTRTLPEPSATLLRYVNDRDVVHLGPRLLPYVGLYGSDPALSVSRSPKPSVPVFLLHGLDDHVIPPVESEYLADDLRARAPVRLLLSRLISQAEADHPVRVNDVLQLAGFWGDLLSR
jgi:dienelactone hydrolase